MWLNKKVSGDGEYGLHHHKACFCENGRKGKQKKTAAKKKMKEFYETTNTICTKSTRFVYKIGTKCNGHDLRYLPSPPNFISFTYKWGIPRILSKIV